MQIYTSKGQHMNRIMNLVMRVINILIIYSDKNKVKVERFR